jgi:hypothetical protein
LNAQGGVDRFVEISRRYFRCFIESGSLRAGHSEPRAIQDLPGIVGAIAGLDFTDILLLP